MKAGQSGNFKAVPLPEPQTTVARCYSVIHIGTVPQIFNNQVKGMIEKMHITWELPRFLADFGKEKMEPFVVGEELALSTSDNSNLSKLIANWRGKPFTKEEQQAFDPSVMVGKTCMLQFVHARKKKFVGQNITEVTNENTMLILQSVMKRPAEIECPAAMNPPFIWDWEPVVTGKKQFNTTEFEKMPKWLQEKVKGSEEYKKYAGGTTPVPNQTAGQQPSKVDEDTW